MVEQQTAGDEPADRGDQAAERGRTARPRHRPVSPGQAFWTSFLLFFGLFTAWAVGNPLTAAPDEPSHATKAAAVVRGELVGQPVEGEPDGFGSVHVPNLIWQSQGWPMCYYFRPEVPASCEPEDPQDPGRIVYAVTTASSYNPLYYSVTGLPTLLPLGREMLLLMRLVSAVLCGFAMAWAVRALTELRSVSWPVLGLLAATTPMVVYLASTVSPAGLEICTAIGLWTALLAVVHHPDPTRLTSRMAGIAVLASVLVNLRGMSPLFLAIIVGSVVASAPWASTWGTLRDRRSWPWLGLVAVASVAALAWIRFAGALPTSKVAFPEWGFVRAAKASIYDTPVYLRNMVGQFGWVDTELPIAVVGGVLVVIAGIVVVGVVRGTVRERVVLVGLGLVTLGLPVLIQAWQAKHLGIVWQGRYFLPVAVGLPLLAAFAVRGRATTRQAGRWFPVVAGALMLAQLIAFAVNLHRYAVGADGPWWGSTPDIWRPPLPIPVLFAACAGLLVALLWLLLRIARTDVQADDAFDGHAAAEPSPDSAAGP